MISMATAATTQVHHGLPLPGVALLKKCRITVPTTMTSATMTQFQWVANDSG